MITNIWFLLGIAFFVFSFLINVSCLALWLVAITAVLLFWLSFYLTRPLSRWGFVRWAVLWMVFEFLKDRMLGGLPWGDLYSWVVWFFPWNQVLRIVPVYVVSVSVLWVLVSGGRLLLRWEGRKFVQLLLVVGLWGLLGGILCVWDGPRYPRRLGIGEVCLFQTGIPHLDKVRMDKAPDIWAEYDRVLTSYRHSQQAIPRGVIFPETMAIYTWPDDDLLNRIYNLKKRFDWIVLGANLHDGGCYYNAQVYISGEGIEAYKKRKLVPFGEYIPFARIPAVRGLVDTLVPEGGGEYCGGKEDVVFEIHGKRFLPLICYEDSFYYLVSRRIKEVGKVNGIIVVSNDDWFGRGLAQLYHLSMSRVMAIKFRLWVIRVNNDGFSCIIDPFGRIIYGNLEWNSLGHRWIGCVII